MTTPENPVDPDAALSAGLHELKDAQLDLPASFDPEAKIKTEQGEADPMDDVIAQATAAGRYMTEQSINRRPLGGSRG